MVVNFIGRSKDSDTSILEQFIRLPLKLLQTAGTMTEKPAPAREHALARIRERIAEKENVPAASSPEPMLEERRAAAALEERRDAALSRYVGARVEQARRLARLGARDAARELLGALTEADGGAAAERALYWAARAQLEVDEAAALAPRSRERRASWLAAARVLEAAAPALCDREELAALGCVCDAFERARRADESGARAAVLTPRTRPYLIAAESSRKTPKPLRRADSDETIDTDSDEDDATGGCEDDDVATLRYYLQRSALKPRKCVSRVVL